MAIPKHFKLVKEHQGSYEIHDSRDNRIFHIAKHGLDLGMHGELSKIQPLADGSTDVEAPFNPDDLTGPNTTPQGVSLAQNIGSDIRSAAGDAAQAFGDVVGGVAKPVLGAASDVVRGLVTPTDAQASTPPSQTIDSQDTETKQTPVTQSQPSTVSPLVTQAQESNAALQAEQNAIIAGAQAETKQGKDTAAAYGSYANKIDKMLTPQQVLANHQVADSSLEKAYMDKKIDPNHYMNSLSTGRKIDAALGLIFGGIGAGMTGGPNYAHQTIQNAIQRDIEAQQNDQSKTMNLWKMNREATHNDLEANLATQNQLLAGVKAKALQYMGENAGPQAAARIAPVISQIQQQMNMNNLKRSLISSGPQGVHSMDPASLLGMITDKGQQEGAAKEIANAQKVKSLQSDFESSAHDLQSKTLNGLLSPHDRSSAVNAFAGQIATASEHRFNMAESTIQADALLPQPGDSGETLANKAQRRKQFFSSMVQAPIFKSATGMDLNNFESTNTNSPSPADQARQQQLNYAHQNMNNTNPQIQARVQFIRNKYGM